MNKNTNKSSRQKQLQNVLAGLAKHFSNVKQITMGGARWSVADVTKLLQQDLAAMEASAQALTVLRKRVQVERDTHAKAVPVLRSLKAYVQAIHGSTQVAIDTLADFGYAPRKSGKQMLATKVEAQVQAKATRKARHTLGKKQKAEIKGTVPATSPAASAPAPVPAPPGASAQA